MTEKIEIENQKALEEADKARLQALEEKDQGLVMEYTEDDCFIVKHDGAVLTNVPVWCEDAEDACLYRAYSWVQPLIEKVYALGKQDGYLEGLREAK